MPVPSHVFGLDWIEIIDGRTKSYDSNNWMCHGLSRVECHPVHKLMLVLYGLETFDVPGTRHGLASFTTRCERTTEVSMWVGTPKMRIGKKCVLTIAVP